MTTRRTQPPPLPKSDCPPLLELVAAASGERPQVARHAGQCPICGPTYRAQHAMRELAVAWGAAEAPSRGALARMSAALLDAAEAVPARSGLDVAPAGARDAGRDVGPDLAQDAGRDVGPDLAQDAGQDAARGTAPDTQRNGAIAEMRALSERAPLRLSVELLLLDAPELDEQSGFAAADGEQDGQSGFAAAERAPAVVSVDALEPHPASLAAMPAAMMPVAAAMPAAMMPVAAAMPAAAMPAAAIDSTPLAPAVQVAPAPVFVPVPMPRPAPELVLAGLAATTTESRTSAPTARRSRVRRWAPVAVAVAAAAVAAAVALWLRRLDVANAPPQAAVASASQVPMWVGFAQPAAWVKQLAPRAVTQDAARPSLWRERAQTGFRGAAAPRVVASGRVAVAASTAMPLHVVGQNALAYSENARGESTGQRGVLQSMAVFAGSVEIRYPNGHMQIVSAGEVWLYQPESPREELAAQAAPPPYAAISPVAPPAPTAVVHRSGDGEAAALSVTDVGLAPVAGTARPGAEVIPVIANAVPPAAGARSIASADHMPGAGRQRGTTPPIHVNRLAPSANTVGTTVTGGVVSATKAVGPGEGTSSPGSHAAVSPRSSAGAARPHAGIRVNTNLPENAAAALALPDPSSSLRQAYAEMRAGASAEAAKRFAALMDDPSVGEDATYWAGVCFAKAGDRVPARAALQAYLDRFPEGLQRGRAHLALGRLWRDTDKAKALVHFERAANDPDGGVANVAIDEMTELRGR